MWRMWPLLVAGLLLLQACGGANPEAESTPSGMSMMQSDAADDREARDQAASTPRPKATEAPDGTAIRVGRSEFGPMLFDAKRQAIYIFANDPEGRSVCHGPCARAWPPVFTEVEPTAGPGVKPRLLGTIRRRDGKLQVTYAGKPLYYYAHEGPGQVLCHNVNLNGGFWWVVGPDGKRRA